MIGRITNKLLGDYNEKEIKKTIPIVKKINQLTEEYSKLTDDELKSKTQEFKNRLNNKESLDSILPEAFAVVKQACLRISGQEFEVKGEKIKRNMIPYDVQLVGGIILHKGTIAEMKTGEGKTLVAVAPVYLNALSGKGVHIVTVNDYLASRDAERMGYLYERLGLSVGCVVKGVAVNKRKEEYSKDITYIENSELGFDYLRDNLVKNTEERVLLNKDLNFAIVDEIDSILVDEARTPLIISQPSGEPTEKYGYYAHIVKGLIPCKNKKKVSKGLLHELMKEDNKKNQEEDGDYYIDEKTKTVSLSSRGIAKLENILGVKNLYKDIGFGEIHHIENALKAHAVFKKDKEYIIQGNEVLIVDEHTGRAMVGRRFSEGLHQAIEAKENVEIKKESKTIATITYQNFFKQYNKLAGMTGTAATEGEEFNKIYDLSVVVIPTNKKIIRVDKSDKVYFSQKAKRKFVKEYIDFYHEIGQPILIGTSNIQTSEYVSSILSKDGIVHNVLNAKFHEQEANIVSNAGKFKSIVVATNMAGRGTDIKLEKGLNDKLSENYAKRIQKQIKQNYGISAVVYSSNEYELTLKGIKNILGINDEQIDKCVNKWQKIDNIYMKIKINTQKKYNTDAFAEIIIKPSDQKKETIINKDFHYGLFILGTEKHESRRIDNQLRGRSGRQGDAGVSIFFVALDDLIMRKMGGERIQSMASMLLSKNELDNIELTQKQFTNSITRAQKQIEGRHFSIRKHLFEYDSVINKQRQRIYQQRDEILKIKNNEENQEEFVEKTNKKIKEDIKTIIQNHINIAQNTKQSINNLLGTISKELGINFSNEQTKILSQKNLDEIENELSTLIYNNHLNKIKEIDKNRLFNSYKEINLHFIDKLWIDHIDQMQHLKDKVGLMGYAQLDPLIIYKKEAYEKFQGLLYRLKVDITNTILNLDFEKENIQAVNPKQIDSSYLDLLKEISGSEDVKKMIENSKNTAPDPRQKIFQDEDGFEVFEVNEENESKKIKEPIDTIKNKKTRPNDPCPCGSGKKYKKCCGIKK